MDDLMSDLLFLREEKEAKWGPLKDLDSRDLVQNSENIDEFCVQTEMILRLNNILTQENTSVKDPDCVFAFQYLLLNTEFTMHEKLTEDSQCGDLDDMSCPMSPYLLIEILFFLWYEEIIAESLLHVPLDLTVELIKITKEHLHNLDFDRRLNFLSLLLLNSYKRLNLIAKEGAISIDMDVSSQELMTLCQELMGFFFKDEIVKLSEVKGLQKSERIGHIIKEVLKLTSECLKCEESNIELMRQMRSLYELTYGDESWKPVNNNFRSQLKVFHQTFFETLWQQITMIDESIYNDWAKLEDPSCLMTLQKSIRIDCYRLMDLVKKCKNIKTDKMMKVLDMMKPLEPDTETSISNIQELINNLSWNKSMVLKLLTARYHEWNMKIFKTVLGYIPCMEDEDFSNLLEYYIHIMSKDCQEDYKRRVYTILSNTLRKQDEKNSCEIALAYVLVHNIGNSFKSSNAEENTKTLMSHDLKSPLNRRLVLISMLENPVKFLSILIKSTIGYCEYDHATISPHDLEFLSPIMTARFVPSKTLLLLTLALITTENGIWNLEKWDEFVLTMLEKKIFTEDQLINSVLIPFFEEIEVSHFSPRNVAIMMNTLKDVFSGFTDETSFTRLTITLVKTLTILRRNLATSRVWFSIIVDLAHMTRCDMEAKVSSKEVKVDVARIKTTLESVDPIDDYHFRVFDSPNAELDTESNIVMKSYEKRCSTRLAKIKESLPEDGEEMKNFSMLEDYIRHFFSTCAESEYVLFVESMIARDWRKCNYKNEYEAYDKIVNFTIEACAFALECKDACPKDCFSCLLKSLVKSTKRIMGEKGLEDLKEIDDSLLRHISTLDESIEGTAYSSFYKDFLSQVNNRDTTRPAMENLRSLFAFIRKFSNTCVLNRLQFSSNEKHSVRTKRYKIACEFVSEMINPNHESVNFSSLLETYRFLYPDNENK